MITESKKKHSKPSLEDKFPQTTKNLENKRLFKERSDLFKENKSPSSASFEKYC